MTNTQNSQPAEVWTARRLTTTFVVVTPTGTIAVPMGVPRITEAEAIAKARRIWQARKESSVAPAVRAKLNRAVFLR